MIFLCPYVYLVVRQTPGVSLKVTHKNSEKTTTTLVNVQLTAEIESANNTGKFKTALRNLYVHIIPCTTFQTIVEYPVSSFKLKDPS